MKCVRQKESGKITRISDTVAYCCVHILETHYYISKSAWKRQKLGKIHVSPLVTVDEVS
jgi:hypothetical protein